MEPQTIMSLHLSAKLRASPPEFGCGLLIDTDAWAHLSGQKLAVQEPYTLSSFLRLPNRSLQGIAVRPLPCNYYVIQ